MKTFTIISSGGTCQNVYQIVSPEQENLYARSRSSRFYCCTVQAIAEELLAKPGHSNPTINEPPFWAVVEIDETNAFHLRFADEDPVFAKAAFYNYILPVDQRQGMAESAKDFVNRQRI